MKYFYQKFILLALVMLLALGQQAQPKIQPWELGLGFTLRDFYGIPSGQISSSLFNKAGTLHVGRYINPSFAFNLSAGLGIPESNYQAPEDVFPVIQQRVDKLYDLDLRLTYKTNNGYMLPEDSRFAPYVSFGVGMSSVEGETNFALPWGVGTKIQWSDAMALDFSGYYKPSFTNFESYMAFTAAIVFKLGKPIVHDKDQDGVPDEVDRCPTEAGTKEANGCVDTDADGIADQMDLCPDEAGIAKLKGCPEDKDMDKDGVEDELDQCPQTPGTPSTNGCPDSDRDGIVDTEDRCPTVNGSPETKGCPDRDTDTVPDNDDACPDDPGTAELKGCPDSDNDGLSDKQDKCPGVAGSLSMSGCPEVGAEARARLALLTTTIQFEPASAVVSGNSYAFLDELVNIVKEYPAHRIIISGHTDSFGKDSENLQLSIDRAKACADYILSRGVESERVRYEGFGETRPIADNKTSAGRTKNRRLEFSLVVN